MISMIKRNL